MPARRPRTHVDELDGIDLLRLFSEEERYWLSEYQSRIAFFSGLLSAIVAAIGFGFVSSPNNVVYLVIALMSATLIYFSRLARDMTFRIYRRYLETIVKRAKLEHHLGLDRLTEEANRAFWQGEGLTTGRHMETRQKFDRSDDFIVAMNGQGYQLGVEKLLGYCAWLGVICLLAAITLLVLDFACDNALASACATLGALR